MSELKAYIATTADGTGLADYYLKSDADKVISELKDKCQMHDFFWEGCGFAKRGFKNTIAVSEAFDKLEANNAELTQELAATRQVLQLNKPEALYSNLETMGRLIHEIHDLKKACKDKDDWCAHALKELLL